MPTIFEIENKDGVVVALDEATWERHILDGHPDVAPFIEEVKATIKGPDLIYRHAGALIYSKLGAVDKPKFRHLYLEVIVRESGFPPVGMVLTVHFSRFPPKKGELIWMQKN